MTAMRLLPAAGFRHMPWKNGGGTTTEIAVHPPKAGLHDFDWRLSMARVATPGPFSIFDGIDRSLAVLEGAGLILDGLGAASATLTPDSAPLAFPADIPVSGRLKDGPILDLNIMTRRGRYRNRLERLDLDPEGRTLAVAAGETAILLAAGGRLHVETGTGEPGLALAQGDAACLDREVHVRPEPAGEGTVRAYLVTVIPA